MMPNDSTSITPAAPNSPLLSPDCGLAPSRTFTRKLAAMATRMPTAASTSGRATAEYPLVPAAANAGISAAPSTIVPMIDPT